MNFRTGFFRLWLVCSVFFLCAVFLLMSGEIKESFSAKNLIEYNSALMAPINCKDARGKSGQDFSLMDKPWNIDWNGAPPTGTVIPSNLCWYKISVFRNLYPEYNDLADKKLLIKLYQKAEIQIPQLSPWDAIGRFLIIGVGVPIFFLIIGISLLWIIAGFKNKHAKQ